VTEAEDARAEAPEFLQKEPPKLGLILGGGGALTYAHIGLLQELESQKLSIHSIAGVEWGALVAGAYALKGKAHSVEWSLLKLPVEKFESSGFFSSGKKTVSIEDFNNFLQQTFGDQSFADLKQPFTCPFANVAKEAVGLRRSGRLRNAVRSCWALPPHFEVKPVGANPLGVAEVAQHLRAQGAEIIVYVDVISANQMLPASRRRHDSAPALLWVAQKSLPDLLKPPLVNEVLQLPVSGQTMTSYKSLRPIIRTGQLKAKALVKGLAKKYAD
jgi:NTE family protein